MQSNGAKSFDGRSGPGYAILSSVMRPPFGWPLFGCAVAVASLTLVSCEGGIQVGRGSPRLSVERTQIDFGRVFIGMGPIETTVIRNSGVAPLEVELLLQGDTEGYAYGPPDATIPAGGSLEVQVRFRPRRAGPRTAALDVSSNAPGNSTARIELVALAVPMPDCEDGNGCTVDTFDIETERCIHVAESLPCNDFNACTTGDICVDALCLGAAVDCDDGDSCTDDACDPEAGCVNVPTRRCDDNNPCTRDICEPDGGCSHENLSDGTPCDDAEQCTSADICFRGQCRGVDIPENSPCDDGDPCSFNERCIGGECLDPDYTPPAFTQVAFTATVGALSPGASENLIVDRNDTAYVGIESGIAAVDQCGFLLWINDTLGAPRFSAAVSLPGILTAPIDGTLFDIDTRDGSIIRSLDVDTALPVTASTATVATRILDVTVRNSGALVASVIRTVTTTSADETSGYLVEVDALHTVATRMEDLGPAHASRVGLDRDESLVAILRDEPIRADEISTATIAANERVVRLGILGVPNGTWSSTEIAAVRTDFALGAGGEVLWAAGLTSIDRQGQPVLLLPPPEDPGAIRSGSPVTHRDVVYALVRASDEPVRDRLLALTATTGATVFDVDLPGPTIQHSPAVDTSGSVYVVTADGELVVVSAAGQILAQAPLPITETPLEGIALTLNSRGFLLIRSGDNLFGVRGISGLSNSSWPRHRRDNLSTSHR